MMVMMTMMILTMVMVMATATMVTTITPFRIEDVVYCLLTGEWTYLMNNQTVKGTGPKLAMTAISCMSSRFVVL